MLVYVIEVLEIPVKRLFKSVNIGKSLWVFNFRITSSFTTRLVFHVEWEIGLCDRWPQSLSTCYDLLPQDLFKKVRSILNKLTPEKFNQLMKQVTDLTIDTEERLKGVIDLVFEKAIDEPSFSVAYGSMCRCLATVSRSLSWAEKCVDFGTRESCVCNVIVWLGFGEVHKYSFFVNCRIHQMQKHEWGIKCNL